MTLKCTMILGNCLEVMPTFPKASVQLVFADLPYACTANSWDTEFDVSSFWRNSSNITGPTAAYIFTCTLDLAMRLRTTNRIPYRYDLIWEKTTATGFLNANKMPLRSHEYILIFYEKLPTYIPQMLPASKHQGAAKRASTMPSIGYNGLKKGHRPIPWKETGQRFPTSVMTFASERRQNSLHPTQKPVALLNWLIRTYSNAGDNVLDPTAGSFTTCVAACSAGRNSVGVEKNQEYFDAGVERVRKHVRDNWIRAEIEVRR